jgi:hypothetical protein
VLGLRVIIVLRITLLMQEKMKPVVHQDRGLSHAVVVTLDVQDIENLMRSMKKEELV